MKKVPQLDIQIKQEINRQRISKEGERKRKEWEGGEKDKGGG